MNKITAFVSAQSADSSYIYTFKTKKINEIRYEVFVFHRSRTEYDNYLDKAERRHIRKDQLRKKCIQNSSKHKNAIFESIKLVS